jgi:hypothetical protein
MPPIFDDDNATSFKSGSGFHYSGVQIDNLGASEYTLVGIACDTSSSVTDFAQEIERCLISAIEGCARSPRADNLMLRVTEFNSSIKELHGFRPLTDCHTGKYKGCIKPGGQTVLRDATAEMADAISSYGYQLMSGDFLANGIMIVITDGADVGSVKQLGAVNTAMKAWARSEALESMVTILVGINVQDPVLKTYLESYAKDADFTQYVEAQDASPKTLARLADFISKSVSSQSQAVGTGGPSQTINF